MQELLAGQARSEVAALLKRLASCEALLVDDLGYVQQSREEMEVLFTLLAERYERGSVLLTSNLPFSGWEAIFKDPMTTAAAIDRLVHHSVIIELNLPSYRAEQAKKAKQARQADAGESASGSGPTSLRKGLRRREGPGWIFGGIIPVSDSGEKGPRPPGGRGRLEKPSAHRRPSYPLVGLRPRRARLRFTRRGERNRKGFRSASPTVVRTGKVIVVGPLLGARAIGNSNCR